MIIAPPFDQPYITSVQTKGGIVRIVKLADGSARRMPADTAPCPNRVGAKQTSAMSALHGPRPQAKRLLAGGTDRAMVFLDVLFSKKRDAKRLGAQWDGQMRKWYVPDGVDINRLPAGGPTG